jgi:hypothetical protein
MPCSDVEYRFPPGWGTSAGRSIHGSVGVCYRVHIRLLNSSKQWVLNPSAVFGCIRQCAHGRCLSNYCQRSHSSRIRGTNILNVVLEILRSAGIGLIAGVIYMWPFAASKSYKNLILSGVMEGRFAALLQKIVSLMVGGCAAIGAIIVVRAFSARELAWIDFLSFLASAGASGWFAWRYLYRIRRS